ncbi:sensor histidine kinase [Clostridium sp. Marseille-P299]|uniref:sensor histidine kinase n=1 Tax=Clostridium sp. Marseille-P299 TaxID=1805477 RepID=UPI0008326F88|nr:HAMP domain-containing sensor histidine kinase [Clostridium sp. Marseille-P299]
MNFFRNPEIKKSLIFYVIFILATTIGGFYFEIYVGYYILVIGLVFAICHFVLTYKRYQKIAKLSALLDSILHGSENVSFDDFSEGELSILQNELTKMTAKLWAQKDELLRDKLYLTDSIADISHQLRTPLTSINLICNFLSKSELTDEKRRQLSMDLSKILKRIEWLISSLLKLSKIDAGTVNFKQEAVYLKELIEKSITPLMIPMELKEQQFNVHMTGDESYIGDLSWSIEAISNILKNCMEHTPVGGKIDVICVENNIYTEIVIKDNGSGIEKEDLPHIFERFYKGKDSSDQSVGIGLALARVIIVEQNGTVKVENNLDGGAKFTIRFYKQII